MNDCLYTLGFRGPLPYQCGCKHTVGGRGVDNDTGTQEDVRHRTTIYLDSEDLASLDELKAYYRRRHGRYADRSELIRVAVRRMYGDLIVPGTRGE